MWHDVHSHPQQLPEPERALERAVAQGVATVVAATEKPSEAPDVLALRKEFPHVIHLAVGLHPATATIVGVEAARQELRALDAFLGQAAAIGEIGLDYKYAGTDPEKTFQAEVLEAQLALAANHRLPVQLHSRWAQRQTMEAAIAFTEDTGLGALLHWFTSSKKLIRITNERGVYISAGPSVLFDEQTRGVVATVRLDRLLLETDCPVPIGGVPNEPAKAAAVAQKVAEIHGLSLEALAEQMQCNLDAYLGGGKADR